MDSKGQYASAPPAAYPVGQQQPMYPPQGSAYYSQAPPPGYAGQPQQPAVVMVSSGAPTQSFTLHIVLSCFIFWCCGCLCGLVAFILAIVAQDKARDNAESARQLGKASIGVSIAGLIIGLVIIVISIVYSFMVVKVASETFKDMCKYQVDDQCYSSRGFPISGEECRSNGLYNHSDGYCYYSFI